MLIILIRTCMCELPTPDKVLPEVGEEYDDKEL